MTIRKVINMTTENDNICFICLDTRPSFGYSKWTCNGHPYPICESCTNKCISCPLCRAEPDMKYMINDYHVTSMNELINVDILKELTGNDPFISRAYINPNRYEIIMNPTMKNLSYNLVMKPNRYEIVINPNLIMIIINDNPKKSWRYFSINPNIK